MSKFTPRQIDDTVNIPKDHPLKEFGAYLFKGLAFFLVIYLLIGFALEFFVTRLSVEQEQWVWTKTGMASRFVAANDDMKDKQEYVQKILDKIPAPTRPEGYDFTVIVTDNKDPNAFALPGGRIVVTKGLLSTLDTENALTFVLGHELGHFKNRDHLRGMGFGLTATLITATLAGQDAGITNAVSGLTNMATLTYSRRHEAQADLNGLEALNDVYGHAGGATEFFEKIIDLNKESKLKVPAIMSTHPDSDDRIERIKELIEEQKLGEKSLRPIRTFAND